ncbi:hypothetical protein Tco_0832166 [Tanacetum coccineum]
MSWDITHTRIIGGHSEGTKLTQTFSHVEIRISSPTDGANVKLNLRGLLGLGKNDLNVNEYPGILGSFGVTSSNKKRNNNNKGNSDGNRIPKGVPLSKRFQEKLMVVLVVVAKKVVVDERAFVQCGGGTLGGDEIGEFKSSFVEGDVDKLVDFSLEAIEDEEVSLVDGVFEGAFGALGEETWYCGDGVVVSSCVRSINNLFGGIMLIFGLLEEVA